MKLWTDSSYPIILSCAKCLAPWVKREVCELGYEPIDEAENIVVVKGSMRDVLKLNLRLRTAHRVLVPLLRARCRHVRELYELVASIDWENLIDADGYFSVSSIVHNDTVRDTRLPSLVTKDAIADRMRTRCGTRPDSGPDYDRGAAVFLHWERDRMIIYLDTSGAPLSKRGYRKIPGSAPMQETLAAACISAMKWDRKTPFVSPMCGSGTIPIEAAMIANNIAPSLGRSFAAEQWTFVEPAVFARAREEANDARRNDKLQIVGSDIDPHCIDLCKKHAKKAGVMLDWKVRDVKELATDLHNGVLICNPPYGERLSDAKSVKALYRTMQNVFARIPDWQGNVITSNREFEQLYGKPADRRRKLSNGGMVCTLYQYNPVRK